MPEFQSRPTPRQRLRNAFLRPGLLGMSLVVAFVFAVTGPNIQRLGDRFQYALPLMALGCSIAEGSTVRYVGRFVLLEAFIHVPKNALGHAAINMRPNGHDKGFPSGHTSAASFGATAMVTGCLQGNPWAQSVAIVAAGFTGASRIATRNHNIWQVLAGAILGLALNLLTLAAFDSAFARFVAWLGRLLRLRRRSP